MQHRYKQAFTLAEVLITLAMIGIVSALTIPSLIQNSAEKQFKTTFKKTYSTLDQASKMIMNNSGGALVGVFVGPEQMRDQILECMPAPLKKCNSGTPTGNCFTSEIIKTYSGLDDEHYLIISQELF